MRVVLKALLSLLFFAGCVVADELDATNASVRLRLAPVSLEGGGTLRLDSPSQWAPLARDLSEALKQNHRQFSRIFGEIPPVTTTLRLMDSDEFYKETGAPSWTNAMYFRRQIIIPVSFNEEIDIDNLYRSIKHEYAHSVINALSAGRCPGWLDEGLAQWVEGRVNPALEPALARWIGRNTPIPLNMLQGGFTKLDTGMVPAAYAQSLFASKVVINTYGFQKLKSYLTNLRSGVDKGLAFESAFGSDAESFEQALADNLRRWAGHHRH